MSGFNSPNCGVPDLLRIEHILDYLKYLFMNRHLTTVVVLRGF